MKHYWSNYDRFFWANRPPSRRLRKLYRELETLDQEIERARTRDYCPDHAPTDFVVRRRVLHVLFQERFALEARINHLQNDD